MSFKHLLLIAFLLPLALADCTDLISSNYEDETYGAAHAEAKIEISRIYGEECSTNPFHSYAKVTVKCTGTQLYMLEMPQTARWDDVDFGCGYGGCTNYDQSWYPGTHEVTLKNSPGQMKSYFFSCYGFDEQSGQWSWVTAGWGYWGDREVIEKPQSDCAAGQKFCIDIDMDGTKNAFMTCKDTNGDGYFRWDESPITNCPAHIECIQTGDDAECEGEENQPPASNPSLEEKQNGIELTTNYNDPDGDPEEYSIIFWYVNDDFTHSAEAFLTNEVYEYQDIIKLEYTPCDNQGNCGDKKTATIASQIECTKTEDCSGSCDGYWECISNECSCHSGTTECTIASDCEGNSHTEECVGEWECEQGECNWICDNGNGFEIGWPVILLIMIIAVLVLVTIAVLAYMFLSKR